MKRLLLTIVLMGTAALSGCATIPSGPTVHVFPGPEKTFEEFQADDSICRIWAAQRIGLTPEEIRNQSTISGASIGSVIGAGLGALLGSASGHAGIGAAIGAGTGLLIGSSAGADHGRVYGYEAQRQYNGFYLQCMYLKGNQVPGVITPRRSRQYYPAPPPPAGTAPRYAPPPDAQAAPPGTPPPPAVTPPAPGVSPTPAK